MAINFNLLHSRLEQERRHLTEELAHLEASKRLTGDRTGSWFGKRDEQANEAIELRKQQSSEKRLKDLLAKVEYVLHKFDEGSYGLCDNCGQPIKPARLEALPYANLCLNCKALQEE
ncbi:TraR/DksA family transcriptional regulator [Chloroflexota bacterium]